MQPQPSPLAHRVIGPPNGPTAFILHGILGQASNLHGLARPSRPPPGVALRAPGSARPWRLAGGAAPPSRPAPRISPPWPRRSAHRASWSATPSAARWPSSTRAPGADVWVLDAPPGAADPGQDHEVHLSSRPPGPSPPRSPAATPSPPTSSTAASARASPPG
ncbi:MAG: hypothetical protein R3F43_16955 [bacterium]